MTRTRKLTFSSLLALAGLLGAAACGAPASTKAPAASATSCADYATRICKEAGEESETCGAVKSTTELMPAEACAAALSKVDEAVKKLADKRKPCDTLIEKLCKDLGDTTATCTMVRTETAKFPVDRCEMMLSRYDEVIADLQKMEEKNKPLSAEKVEKLAAGTVPAFGPADAKVTIVEFSDFECPFCSRAAAVATQVKAKYADKVRFVFRQFPLSFHKNAHLAAQASLAANAQGKFWEFHDKLFQNQSSLDRASLEKFAKEVGLNVDRFKKDLDDKTYASAVDADFKLGEEVAVEGTPSMFLNGARVANPTDFETLSKQIDDTLAGG